MTHSTIENMSKVKQIFIEESQNYIRELREKTSVLDVRNPKFYQHLDFLIVTNSLLRESATRANFCIPNHPFLVVSQNFDQSINLLRDRYFDIDWIIKGLLLEAIDLISQIINAYCLDLAANPNWINLQAELFEQIKEHLRLDDDKFVQIESLESGDHLDEPFTLSDGIEDSQLFDYELSQEFRVDLSGSNQELQTLFPSLLPEPFEGDLDDLLDSSDLSDLEQLDPDLLGNNNLNSREEARNLDPLPMPEMLINIFTGSDGDKLLGSDDETELQGFNWNNLEEDTPSYNFLEETDQEYEDIDNMWTKISNLESWSEMDDSEVSLLKELEASFDLIGERDFADSADKFGNQVSAQSQEPFEQSEEDDCLFWNSLDSEGSLSSPEILDAYPTVQDNSLLATLQESLKPDFATPEVDTAFEESPIYHGHDPKSLSSLKESLSRSNDHNIKIPLSYMEMLGDLSEELSVRKSGVDVYLGELRVLSTEAQQNISLLNSELGISSESAIAQLQHTFDKLSNMLDRTVQQADAMNQDVTHLRQHLRQSLKHPVSGLVGKFPRILQNLSTVHGKQVELILQGAEVGIERSLSEPIAESLEILLRKAFKHGIETPYERQQLGKSIQAKISVTAEQTNSGIVIKVSDDGRGIDVSKIRSQLEQSALIAGASTFTTIDMNDDQIVNLIFEPNFDSESSIYPTESSKLSDVRQKVRAVGGKISVQTQPNQGTEFTISFPNPVSLVRVLLIDINHVCMAVSSQSVLEVLPVPIDIDLREQQIPATLLWRDRNIPIVKLNSLLKLNSPQPTNHLHQQAGWFTPNTSIPSFLVIQHEETLFALLTDGCWHDQEATFHQVEGDIVLPPIFIGTVILSNNQAVALLNTVEIIAQSSRSQSNEMISSANTAANSEQLEETPIDYIDNLSSLSDFFGADAPSLDLSKAVSVNSHLDTENLEKSGTITQNTPRPSKILIVESSANVRRYLAMTLSKSGFITEQAQDSKEAIALLKHSHLSIDVIITDLEMPQMDGFKVLTDIRADESLQYLPVIVLTSKNNAHDQKLASDLGATAYFSKPYREQELISKLQELVTIKSKN